jgi:hypothetical protein
MMTPTEEAEQMKQDAVVKFTPGGSDKETEKLERQLLRDPEPDSNEEFIFMKLF